MKNQIVKIMFAIGLLLSCQQQQDSDEVLITNHPNFSQLDSLIHVYNELYKPAGFAIGIVDKNQLIYARGFGKSDINKDTRITARSVFHLASISKSFVSVTMMQLIEKGLVDLDEPLTTYLPYFKMTDDRFKQITIRHLLSHRSGIPDVEDEDDYEWDKPRFDSLAVERFIKDLKNRKLKFKPGDKRLYSNYAYDILAEVILKTSKLSLENYTKNMIFKPLQMNQTTFIKTDVLSNFATQPHVINSRNLNLMVSSVYPYNRIHAASSTLHSNVLDMSRYAVETMQGYHSGNQILKKSSYEQIFNDGLGWPTGKINGHQSIWTSGNDIGFSSYFVLLPDDSISVTVLTNCEYFPCEDVARNVASVLLGKYKGIIKKPVSRLFIEIIREKPAEEAFKQIMSLPDDQKDTYDFDWRNIGFLGWRAVQQNNNKFAISLLEQFPKGDFVNYALGKAYMQDGDTLKALNNFNKVLENDPTHYRATAFISTLQNAGK